MPVFKCQHPDQTECALACTHCEEMAGMPDPYKIHRDTVLESCKLEVNLMDTIALLHQQVTVLRVMRNNHINAIPDFN
jgi:hypothetical protein